MHLTRVSLSCHKQYFTKLLTKDNGHGCIVVLRAILRCFKLGIIGISALVSHCMGIPARAKVSSVGATASTRDL